MTDRTCDNCNGRFDVSLPDDDEHVYVCECCEAEVCYECRCTDEYGITDCCPDCYRVMVRAT
jgi:hypothetical protein